ncbi:MAG: diguanylate cyclase [Bradymonadales bacterium]|nr:diguanylate cyclase [Bradymonadales bacterium]
MDETIIKALIVDGRSNDRAGLRTILQGIEHLDIDLAEAESLAEALEAIGQRPFDIILLDLDLPDSQGMQTFYRIHAAVPAVPLIIWIAVDNETLATDAVREGAQDYLVKGQCDSQLVDRALRYAIERHRMVALLKGLTLVDDLTGLYNRRGFETLANQNLKLANRTRRKLLAISADLDGLGWINSTFGPTEGDQALVAAGGVLKETFRETDILARIGGDEFAIMVLEASEEAAELLTDRLRRNLARYNAIRQRPYDLSLEVGVACYDPATPCTIDELVGLAGRERRKRGN